MLPFVFSQVPIKVILRQFKNSETPGPRILLYHHPQQNPTHPPHSGLPQSESETAVDGNQTHITMPNQIQIH